MKVKPMVFRPGVWYQVGGDMNPCKHGATLLKWNGNGHKPDTLEFEVIEIQPVREYVGDKEAAEVGYPYWTRTACYSYQDLLSCMDDKGFRNSVDFWSWFPELAGVESDPRPDWRKIRIPIRALVGVAESALSYGWQTEDGEHGWHRDVLPKDYRRERRDRWGSLLGYALARVNWNGNVTRADWRAEDWEFRRDVLKWKPWNVKGGE